MNTDNAIFLFPGMIDRKPVDPQPVKPSDQPQHAVEWLKIFVFLTFRQTVPVMPQYLLLCQFSVHRHGMAACLFTKRYPIRLFTDILRHRHVFIKIIAVPSHRLMFPHPPFMLHRRNACDLFRRKRLQHVEIHRSIRVEAVNGIQIPAETLHLVEIG